MSTSCEIDFSEDEKKRNWYYSISIPYELNHDFFMKARILVNEWKIPWIPLIDLVSFPDYWRWINLYWLEIDNLINRINEFEKYLDVILNFVPIPTNIWHHDGNVTIWYEYFRSYNNELNIWIDPNPYTNFVNTWPGYYFDCEKKDIIYIFELIKKLWLKSKKLNKSLKFVWD